ncbi:hypothetical protein Afil01_31690 [Actinorhabdospora filicis]|uniref:Sigma-70 family RNA polymerase sigma factor n=1 Tax=Actinorhabdospora filicis TaxID=1785913 RepID=A0A9W6SM86_9ACTN|nr:sigma-70 family RNA polymerase sigma factor [Actinorhabdospora filicis]GLZ78362.1 hypothetical protein Afil01_31690 [Actinorhabdospora filicis]
MLTRTPTRRITRRPSPPPTVRRPHGVVAPPVAEAGPPEAFLRAIGGDREAFAGIYRDNHVVVRRVILSRLGQADRGLTEDFVQEVFARAWKNIRLLRWRGRDIATWLVTIACNLVRDHWKRAAAREVLGADVVDAPDRFFDAPEDAAISAASRPELVAALAALPHRQRQCVTHRFVHDHSVAETARVLGITAANVKVTTHRALERLARLLGGDR